MLTVGISRQEEYKVGPFRLPENEERVQDVGTYDGEATEVAFFCDFGFSFENIRIEGRACTAGRFSTTSKSSLKFPFPSGPTSGSAWV